MSRADPALSRARKALARAVVRSADASTAKARNRAERHVGAARKRFKEALYLGELADLAEA